MRSEIEPAWRDVATMSHDALRARPCRAHIRPRDLHAQRPPRPGRTGLSPPDRARRAVVE